LISVEKLILVVTRDLIKNVATPDVVGAVRTRVVTS